MRAGIYWILLCTAGQGTAAAQPPAQRPAKPPYEVLQQSAGWCGPRIVYFFACYFGQDCTLKQVVDLCKTDESGTATLGDLVGAARVLHLDPTPVACGADELLSLGGPAILCVRGPTPAAKDSSTTSQTRTDAPVHFIALVGRHEKEGWFWVVDPALSTEALTVHRDVISRAYTGNAVLLKGCPRPRLRPWWLMFPGILGSAVLGGGLTVGLVCLFRKVRLHRPVAG